MKANLLILTILTLATTTVASAKEKLMIEDGQGTAFVAYAPPEFKKGDELVANNEKDMKIATLNKLLDQQQRLYEEKVTYLEEELKKYKDRLVEKSINHDRMQAFMEKRFSEESTFLKKELVAKTKTLMEYQRQLEKVKPSEEMKNLIKVNTELAVELRRSTDQLATIQVRDNMFKGTNANRMPASVDK